MHERVCVHNACVRVRDYIRVPACVLFRACITCTSVPAPCPPVRACPFLFSRLPRLLLPIPQYHCFLPANCEIHAPYVCTRIMRSRARTRQSATLRCTMGLPERENGKSHSPKGRPEMGNENSITKPQIDTVRTITLRLAVTERK